MNIAGTMAKYLATSFAIEKGCQSPARDQHLFPDPDEVDEFGRVRTEVDDELRRLLGRMGTEIASPDRHLLAQCWCVVGAVTGRRYTRAAAFRETVVDRRLGSFGDAPHTHYAVQISLVLSRYGFFTRFVCILGGRKPNIFLRDGIMFDVALTFELDKLDDALRQASTIVPRLFQKVVASACLRYQSPRSSGKAALIDRFIASGAWTDAALTLIELELPNWKIRRVVFENGEWLCSLSRQPNLPIELDDPAEASHQMLPLAILHAFVAARRVSAVRPKAISAVPQVRPATEQLISCDNFA
jgi:hypothetical protein